MRQTYHNFRQKWADPWLLILGAAVLAVTPPAWAAMPGARAQRDPRIGYVYPAGGRQGTTFQAAIGGQYLDGVTGVDIGGGGVQATVIEHVKPLTGKEVNLLRDRLKELQQMMNPTKPDKWESDTDGGTNATANPDPNMDRAALQKEMAEIKKKLANPKNRNRDNPQLSEDVTLKVVLAPDAEPGQRELRLKTASGLSNPLIFHIGQLPEYTEREPNSKTADTEVLSLLPLVINGQILPGDVDRFRLKLSKGTRLVVAASAQELIPYLADGVPGWFQATLALYDANGNEVAYADDYRFHPDPVLFYEIPKDGEYTIEIRDAIYRGREDFVYRIALGELPFVTSIFPLGGPAGAATTVQMKGWNLPADELTLDHGLQPGISNFEFQISDLKCCVPFAVDTLPECLEQEPNNDQASAQPVTLPIIVNGRIDQPGDVDIFCFEGRAGDPRFRGDISPRLPAGVPRPVAGAKAPAEAGVVAEVYARRLDSPLDSVLKLTPAFAGAGPAPAQAGATGRQLAFNDDHEDKGSGLTTHHADSLLSITLPADGTYYLHIGDAQNKGGPAYGYRLRISPPQPDFELRVVPSSINIRAGAGAALTVYALRKDGFSDEITLTLKDAPSGFTLSGGKVPAGQDQAKVTLKVPATPTTEPVSLHLEGRALIQGREIMRPAVPADDMMQAFFYRHLVPAKDLKVAVIPRAKPSPRPDRALPKEAAQKTSAQKP